MENFKSSEGIIKNISTKDKRGLRIRDALMEDLFEPIGKDLLENLVDDITKWNETKAFHALKNAI